MEISADAIGIFNEMLKHNKQKAESFSRELSPLH